MKHFKNIILLTLTVFSCMSFATSSYIAEKFEKLDRNQDGFLTRSEAASDPALWSRFGSYDRDKDTQLSLSEYSLYASK
ncbi:EF-hand domain-containing protein [Pseudoalteromonas sp. Scap03]|uniref:EF-hand domain-containing protein n=1 Tax=unclassified Pseudoalteromonas TaxID=194690 RepID=UPI0015BB6431|nr:MULTISPECIES: EF-hand domain-containing protein [unclassified Pseudoalteromonas]NWL14248.1 EF-hand domain-containing protein [Pseudoalteromonas sp. Scap03]QLE82266.1 EF-hand domain-containing protein [Pseudoalteromonas sp. Scap25]QLE90208.1 EF-hand domain-containing protein [Pseudoalteromonas sp. Scap06]